MILYPSFGKPPAGMTESAAASAAQAHLDKTLSNAGLDQRDWLSRGYSGAYDANALAGKINNYAQAQLLPAMAGSFPGGTLSGMSVVQPGEWTPSGGGHHACIMPAVAEVSYAGAPSQTLEWKLSTVGANPFDFVVFAEIRWKLVTVS